MLLTCIAKLIMNMILKKNNPANELTKQPRLAFYLSGNFVIHCNSSDGYLMGLLFYGIMGFKDFYILPDKRHIISLIIKFHSVMFLRQQCLFFQIIIILPYFIHVFFYVI